MMLSNPGRSRLPRERRRRQGRIAKVEALEGRDLLSTMTFHSPAGISPVQVAATVQPAASAGPRVASVQFVPLTGRVVVQFSGDPTGYDSTSLTNPANYSFTVVQTSSKLPSKSTSKARGGVVLAPEFQVTGVTLSPTNTIGMPQSVVVSIDNNQPIRAGAYRFTIRSGGVENLASQPLEGSFSGTFPSGAPGVGSDFQALLTQKNGTALAPSPTSGASTVPVSSQVYVPSTKAVRVRYAAAKPGQFQLAGGNNITLIPLGHQKLLTTSKVAKPTASSGKKL